MDRCNHWMPPCTEDTNSYINKPLIHSFIHQTLLDVYSTQAILPDPRVDTTRDHIALLSKYVRGNSHRKETAPGNENTK